MTRTDRTAEDDLVTADGTPLMKGLRRANRRRKLVALGLVLPLLAFILVTFILPIGDMLWRSVDNPDVAQTLPHTVEALETWDGTALPPERVFAALVTDLRADLERDRRERLGGKLAVRLNYEMSGALSLISRTTRQVPHLEAPYRDSLIDLNPRWGEMQIWQIIQRESRTLTPSYYLAALDMGYNDQGEVVRKPETQRIYAALFGRTLMLSLAVVGMTLLLGFPIAYLLATLPLRYSNLLMILVLLPFWTSLLVRTTAWIVLLQQQGVINDLLVSLGILAPDQRLQMIHNWIGTIIAMTHILLPFMVLPLYSVMKGISPSFVRAARSLGATQWTAFWRVYVPQTLPGVGAGGILVFIISIGYYITPALVGGQTGQMISNLIAFHMQGSLNWGLAAALGSLLLFGVLGLYWLYSRFFGTDNVKFG